MKKFFLLSIPVLIGLVSLSQDVFINNQGESVAGKVANYKEWERNPVEVLFTQNSGVLITLTPGNCKGFTVSSDKYVSYVGSRVVNPANLSGNTGAQSGSLMVKDTIQVFLREIYRFQGYAIYKLKDAKRTNFYLEKSGLINELEYFEYMDENTIVSFNGYKTLIRQQMAIENNGNLDKRLEKLNYTEEALSNFIAALLNDRNRNTEEKRAKYPSKFFAEAGAGLNLGRLENTYSTNAHYNNNAVAPVIELGMQIYSQRKFGRLFFQPSLSFTAFSHEFKLVDKTTYKFKENLLSLSLAGGYFIRNDQAMSVYFALGFALTEIINYSSTLVDLNNVADKESAENVINKITFQPEIGLVLNRSFAIVVKSILPYKLDVYNNLNWKYETSQFSVSGRFLFGKKLQ